MPTQYLILFSIFGWGVGSLFYKIANDQMHPLMVTTIVTLAYLAVTPLPFMFLSFDKTITTTGVIFSVLGALAMCVGSLGYFFALKSGEGVGQVTAVTSIYPALTLVLSMIFLGEGLTIKKGIGIGLALASMLVFSWK